MREIVIWRWIFGLALVPAAMLAWFVDGPDAGIPFLALSLLGAYPLGLLIVVVLFVVAVWGACWLSMPGTSRSACSACAKTQEKASPLDRQPAVVARLAES